MTRGGDVVGDVYCLVVGICAVDGVVLVSCGGVVLCVVHCVVLCGVNWYFFRYHHGGILSYRDLVYLKNTVKLN